MKTKNNLSVIELNEQEMRDVNGGIFPMIAAAIGLWGGVYMLGVIAGEAHNALKGK